MDYSPRVAQLAPEGAYHMLARAQALEAAGREIVHLEIGQPDFPTHRLVSQAGIQAIQDGDTRYTLPAGIPRLREVIAGQATEQRGVDIQASQVVVCPGAKPALFFPTLAVVREGDEVIYPDPGFPTYEAMIDVSGGIPVPVPLREDQDFAFDLDALDRAVTPRTRMIIINSPSNPTGGVLSGTALAHIADLAARHNLWVLSDEIYSRLLYDDLDAPSIYALPGMAERTIICDGFSKTYAMTGWRLGYGIMPQSLAERVELLLTHAVGCTAAFTQTAGLAALTGPQGPVDVALAEYQRRRDLLVAGLNDLPGVCCRLPQGAFYAFPNTRGTGKRSEWLADFLLDEAGVAVLPGTSFGANGEGYLRLCFANSLDNLSLALDRMRAALDQLV